MSLIAHGAIESWPELEANLRGLAHEIAGYHNKESGLCCPSNETLAKRLKVKPDTIQKWKKLLEEAGVISRERRFVESRETTSNILFHPYRPGSPSGGEGGSPSGGPPGSPSGQNQEVSNREERKGKERGEGTRAAANRKDIGQVSLSQCPHVPWMEIGKEIRPDLQDMETIKAKFEAHYGETRLTEAQWGAKWRIWLLNEREPSRSSTAKRGGKKRKPGSFLQADAPDFISADYQVIGEQG